MEGFEDTVNSFLYHTMSQADDDLELRDLVTEALEKSGLLAAVRAQLRAGVFLALEREHEQNQQSHGPLQQLLSSHDGLFTLLLVQELLDFCQLRHTASVYRAETGQPATFTYQGRDAIMHDFKLAKITEKRNLPLLVQLISILFTMMKNTSRTVDESIKQIDTSADMQTFIVNSPDNYDTTFTSDSTSPIATEDKTKMVLQLNLNHSGNKSVTENLEEDKSSLSQHSTDNDLRVELQTDSERSISEVNNSSNTKNGQNINNSQSNKSVSGETVKKSIDLEYSIMTEISLNSISSNGKRSIQKTKGSITPEEKSSITQSEKGNKSTEKSSIDASQHSNRTELSNDSILEEIVLSEEKRNVQNDDIMNKLTMSTDNSYSFNIDELSHSTDDSIASSLNVLDQSVSKVLSSKQKVNKSNALNILQNDMDKLEKTKDRMKSISQTYPKNENLILKKKNAGGKTSNIINIEDLSVTSSYSSIGDFSTISNKRYSKNKNDPDIKSDPTKNTNALNGIDQNI